MPLNILGITPTAGVPGSSTPRVPVPIIAEAALPAIEDPVIDLLKQLLPVDRPVGSVLERFQRALTTSMTEGATDDAVGKVLTLLRALPIDLKTVTGEQVRSAIDRLGLRYEPMLQAAFAQRVPLSAPQLTAQNLKAALLTLLETPLPGASVSSSSPPMPRSASSAPIQQPPLPIRRSASNLPTEQAPPPATDRALPQLAPAFTQLARENLETILLQQLQSQSKAVLAPQPEAKLPEGKAVQSGPEPQPSGKSFQQAGDPRQQGEKLLVAGAIEQLLQSVNPGGNQNTEAELLKLLQSLPEVPETAKKMDAPAPRLQGESSGEDLPPVISNLRAPMSGQKESSPVEQVQKFAAAKLAPVEPQESAPRDSAPAGLSSPVAAKQGTDVRQQAHELLTVIERTQVLNSVNSERGEPLTFQIPFLLDGRTSTAEFYVERRFEESRQTDPEERHYSVIALLDLSELGAVRVDLALHTKNLSVKVTVERPETEVLASRLLPEFRQTLSEQGFAVEFLKCELKNDGSANGADLRDRTLPAGNELINLRV